MIMAKIVTRPTLTMNLTFTVTEEEARALDALSGYGDDAFIKTFYESLGEHYMKAHEAGLRLFLKSIREELVPILSKLDKAKKDFAL